MTNIHNKVQLIGPIGDCTLWSTINNKPYIRFSISTHTTFFDEEASMREERTIHECIAWNKQAQILEKNVAPGTVLALEGLIISPASLYFSVEKCNTLVQVSELLILSTK